MRKVDTAGLRLLNAAAAPVLTLTTSFVHSRTHRKPAVKRRVAMRMAAPCECRHSASRPKDMLSNALNLNLLATMVRMTIDE